MLEIKMSKFTKICCVIFVYYALWFRHSYSENHIILYGCVFGAIGCMILDILITNRDFRDICPAGVTINLIMCIYSVITGIGVALRYEFLLSQIKTYATFSCICIAICYVSKCEGSIDWIINTILSVCLVIAFYTMFKGYYIKGYGYVLGPEHNPNQLGLLMDVGIFGLAYKTHNKSKKIPRYILVALIYLYAIINCGSRKTILAAAIILILWLLPLFQKLWREAGTERRIMLVLLSGLVIAGAVYYITVQYINTDSFQRMQMLGDDDIDGSSRNRILYYQYAVDYCAEHPVFGIGYSQFVLWNPYRQMAHSTYAEAIADWGVIGSLIYFIPVIIASVTIVRLSFGEGDRYIPRILLALLAMELFLGIGQVWFYALEHLFAWTLIYYLIDELVSNKKDKKTRMESRYVKT